MPRSQLVSGGSSFKVTGIAGGEVGRGFQQGSTGVGSQAMLALLHQGGSVDEESDGECEEGVGEGDGFEEEEEEDVMWEEEAEEEEQAMLAAYAQAAGLSEGEW
jgi:hypothetical protein